jgi:hypothetical protein
MYCSYDHTGRYIVTRDYLSVKVWDTTLGSRGPLLRIPVQDHLVPFLNDLMETECIFDRFEANFSPNNSQIITGTYSNQFGIYDVLTGDKDNSLQLPTLGNASNMFRRGNSPGLLHEESNRPKEIKIPRGRMRGVTEVRADQKVNLYSPHFENIHKSYRYTCTCMFRYCMQFGILMNQC